MAENKRVYADNAATTPVSGRVIEKMMPWLTGGYGNPSSLYSIGVDAARAVREARQNVASLINAPAERVFFTGSGTEADNTALRGIMRIYGKGGKNHLITSAVEHPAILETARDLERMGYEVTILPTDKYGRISIEDLKAAITEKTVMVSIMTANNEVGTIMPIREIGAVCRERGVIFHTDAVQAFGHIPIDVMADNIDLLSASGHKVNAPKGVGALYVRKGLAVTPLVTGGGQEKNIRSGTENVAGIVAFGEAAKEAGELMESERLRLKELSDKLIAGVLSLPRTALTGDPENRLPGSCSFVIEAIEGESLVLMLDAFGICASTGSACSTGSLDPSHVLTAIGLPHEISHGSLRMTLGRMNTMEDVDHILEKLPIVVNRLRSMSPVWNEERK